LASVAFERHAGGKADFVIANNKVASDAESFVRCLNMLIILRNPYGRRCGRRFNEVRY
jgi:hypothetical protein